MSEKSAGNYATVVKGFYRRAGREPPIELEAEDSYLEGVSNDIAEHVTSRSMKFGLKKYLDFLASRSASITSERTSEFLKKKINRIEISTHSKDIESKVVHPSTVSEIVAEGRGKDEEFGVMLRAMYETATRFSGMNQLLWKDVFREEWSGEQLDETQIFISKERSKGKVDGIVEVSSSTLSQLEDIHDEREADSGDLVFLPDLQRRSVYQKAWRLFDQYPDNTTTHSFRHSRLTHLGLQMYEEDGVEYPIIKERLKNYARHRNSDTTEIYIDIVKRKIQQKNLNIGQYSTIDW